MDAIQAGRLQADIVAVISNKANAHALVRAADAGAATAALRHQDYPSRADYDQALVAAIDAFQADIVVLAGFMRVLTPAFTAHYAGRLINIHPSLLPAFPGLQTHQRALAAGVKLHGATVHYVTPELDAGPIIIQAAVPVLDNDDADT